MTQLQVHSTYALHYTQYLFVLYLGIKYISTNKKNEYTDYIEFLVLLMQLSCVWSNLTGTLKKKRMQTNTGT